MSTRVRLSGSRWRTYSSGPSLSATRRSRAQRGKKGRRDSEAAHHFNAVRVRCTSCTRLTVAMQSGGPCVCGESLPRMPEY